MEEYKDILTNMEDLNRLSVGCKINFWGYLTLPYRLIKFLYLYSGNV